MKAKDDPRTTAEYSGDFYSEDDSSCDSEESSSESSPAPISSREQHYRVDQKDHKDHVLVVAGCKSCLMYFMVPKQVEDCPKCCGQLLHFDRSENGSPWITLSYLIFCPYLFNFNLLKKKKTHFVLWKVSLWPWWNARQMGWVISFLSLIRPLFFFFFHPYEIGVLLSWKPLKFQLLESQQAARSMVEDRKNDIGSNNCDMQLFCSFG